MLLILLSVTLLALSSAQSLLDGKRKKGESAETLLLA
ncbi:hypothetical protein G4228_014653 [Cervus hanglu yarkandensis]|nr:hypothetical protein G4228_014653 [Cervus hanglu yarkandensis]